MVTYNGHSKRSISKMQRYNKLVLYLLKLRKCIHLLTEALGTYSEATFLKNNLPTK